MTLIMERPECGYCKKPKSGVMMLGGKLTCGDCLIKWNKMKNKNVEEMIKMAEEKLLSTESLPELKEEDVEKKEEVEEAPEEEKVEELVEEEIKEVTNMNTTTSPEELTEKSIDEINKVFGLGGYAPAEEVRVCGDCGAELKHLKGNDWQCPKCGKGWCLM